MYSQQLLFALHKSISAILITRRSNSFVTMPQLGHRSLVCAAAASAAAASAAAAAAAAAAATAAAAFNTE